ncbi:hypothetical protein HYH03_013113 [Edaphochlamys debaryana]|uniref:Uncharacterized protein n=1 Tax=Edaphochlamys debaryana TaxID=47281 RepID=A0A836BTN1_9CHLO|nr:hypothetical protein HYH03_013113 [Edaphochlamys debaryana]|eukprot:KAG2488262.1 hypothetical protein HYH03_013113 [Edaphochlamys debaryana]
MAASREQQSEPLASFPAQTSAPRRVLRVTCTASSGSSRSGGCSPDSTDPEFDLLTTPAIASSSTITAPAAPLVDTSPSPPNTGALARLLRTDLSALSLAAAAAFPISAPHAPAAAAAAAACPPGPGSCTLDSMLDLIELEQQQRAGSVGEPSLALDSLFGPDEVLGSAGASMYGMHQYGTGTASGSRPRWASGSSRRCSATALSAWAPHDAGGATTTGGGGGEDCGSALSLDLLHCWESESTAHGTATGLAQLFSHRSSLTGPGEALAAAHTNNVRAPSQARDGTLDLKPRRHFERRQPSPEDAVDAVAAASAALAAAAAASRRKLGARGMRLGEADALTTAGGDPALRQIWLGIGHD